MLVIVSMLLLDQMRAMQQIQYFSMTCVYNFSSQVEAIGRVSQSLLLKTDGLRSWYATDYFFCLC